MDPATHPPEEPLLEIIIEEDVVPRGEIDLKKLTSPAILVPQPPPSEAKPPSEVETEKEVASTVQEPPKIEAPPREEAREEEDAPAPLLLCSPSPTTAEEKVEDSSEEDESVGEAFPLATLADPVRQEARAAIHHSLRQALRTLLLLVGLLSVLVAGGYYYLRHQLSPPQPTTLSSPPAVASLPQGEAQKQEKPQKRPSPPTQSTAPLSPQKPRTSPPKDTPKGLSPEQKAFLATNTELFSQLQKLRLQPEALWAFVRQKKGKKARPYLELLAALGEGKALLLLGHEAFRHGQYKRAKELYQRALKGKIETDLLEAIYHNLALIALQEGNDEASQKYFQKLQRQMGLSAESMNSLGNWARERKNFPEAIEWYEKALRRNPQFYPALYNLAETLLLTGDLERAEETFEALKRAPQASLRSLAYLGLGKVAYFRGQYGKVLSLLSFHGLASSPQAKLYQALALWKQGKPLKAYQILTALPKKKPAHEYHLALLEIELNQKEKAKKRLEKLMKHPRWRPQALFALANLWESLGNYVEAISCYEKLLQLKPHHSGAHNNLALIYAGGEEYNKALEHFSQAIRFAPYEPKYYRNRGFVWLKKKVWEKALEDWKKYLQLKRLKKEEDPELEKMFDGLQKYLAQKR